MVKNIWCYTWYNRKDWIDNNLKYQDLLPYFGPSDKELENAGVKAIFLGYIYWDQQHKEVAAEHGFKSLLVLEQAFIIMQILMMILYQYITG